MNDREKVIRGLECISGYRHMEANPCAECGYNECQTFAICVGEVARDALELLKEQEPVTPITTGKGILERTRCGACGSEIAKSHFYCWFCGRKTKWDD